MKKKIVIFAVLFCSFLCVNQVSDVLAVEYQLLESVPWKQKDAVVAFPEYVEGFYNFAVAFVAIAALLMITIGGFYYIISAGNQAQAGTAKTIVKDALIGLVVVFLTWLVLNTINPDLLNIEPDISILQNTQQTPQINQRFSYTAQSNTHCRNINGDVRCFGSKDDCDNAAGPSAIASVCKPIEQQLEKTKWYERDANGNFIETTQEDCVHAQDTGSGNSSCGSGTNWYENLKYTAKTAEEVNDYISRQSENKTTLSTNAKVLAAMATDKTQDHMITMGEITGAAKITKINAPESYDIATTKSDGSLISGFNNIKSRATQLSREVKKDGASTITTFVYQYPDDFANEKLAGTKVTYSETSYPDAINPNSTHIEYSDATIIVPQAQNAKDMNVPTPQLEESDYTQGI